MATVDTMMTFGLSARQARAVIDREALGVEGLMKHGFHAEAARAIHSEATTERLMAVGMSAALAKAMTEVFD